MWMDAVLGRILEANGSPAPLTDSADIYIYIYPRNMVPVVGDYVPSLSLSKYGVSGASGIYKWYYVVIIQI